MVERNRDRPTYHQWYSTYRWQQLRKAHRKAQPHCVMCLPRVVPAKVVDHIEPHKGDEHKFWNGPFQSLCLDCHNGEKQRREKGSKPKVETGTDGWPK
jgi:5-methylcytosine-specific restriction protein A